MSSKYPLTKVRIRSVIQYAASIAVIVALAMMIPVWVQQIRDMKEHRLELLKAKATLDVRGLEPCYEFFGSYHDDVDRILTRSAGGTPRFSITSIPSFRPESGVFLIGNKLVFVQLDKSIWKQETPHPDSEITELHIPAKASSVMLAGTTADALMSLVKTNIAHATKSDRMGLDGVTYIFSTDSGGCALTWSPDGATRAGRLIDLLGALQSHSRLTDPARIAASEKNLLQMIDDLNSRVRVPSD